MFLAVVIVLASVGVARLAPAVRADQPIFEEIDFSYVDPFLSEECGFPVGVTVQGTLIITSNGNTTGTRGAGYTVTFTNLDSGKSFYYKVAGLQSVSDSIAGDIETLVFSFSGNAIHVVVPGQGDLVHQAGRVVDTFTINFDTGEVSFSETVNGTQKGALTDELICELLSP
jgi:hypothetical protein